MAVSYVNFSVFTSQIPTPIPAFGTITISSLAPTAGAATSAVLSTMWGGSTGSTYTIIFSNAAIVTGVTLTNGSTAASWSTPVSAATGTATVTGYIPATAGNQIILIPSTNSTGSGVFTLTGSASSPSVVPVSSLNNFTDGVGNTYAVWDNLSVAAGTQYWTVTQPNGDYISSPGLLLEFSGAVSVKNAVYNVVASPGAGGTIAGVPVTVASGDILVTVLWDGSDPYATPATISTAGSTTITTYSSTAAYYFTGTGASITPSYTASATTPAPTDTYLQLQFVMSKTSSGGTNSATVAWING
jgi:hypothetical protein